MSSNIAAKRAAMAMKDNGFGTNESFGVPVISQQYFQWGYGGGAQAHGHSEGGFHKTGYPVGGGNYSNSENAYPRAEYATYSVKDGYPLGDRTNGGYVAERSTYSANVAHPVPEYISYSFSDATQTSGLIAKPSYSVTYTNQAAARYNQHTLAAHQSVVPPAYPNQSSTLLSAGPSRLPQPEVISEATFSPDANVPQTFSTLVLEPLLPPPPFLVPSQDHRRWWGSDKRQIRHGRRVGA